MKNFNLYISKRALLCLLLFTFVYSPFYKEEELEKYFYKENKVDIQKSSLAICLKTGVETAYDRVPIQLLTFLKGRNPLVISDYEESIGDVHVKDTMPLEKKRQNLPERLHSNSIAKDEQKPDEATQGWKLDAWKNIPGFKIMNDMFSFSDWHIMIDDDTYLFINNLEAHLKTLRADFKYYLGAPNMFVGCDGVRSFGEGPSFAHGGSGIVVSKASLRAMVDDSERCVNKYQTCWAGDIRTSLCLRDQGILIDGDASKGSFHGHPPHKHNYHNACEQPFTFHHLFPNQIQILYEMEQQIKRERGIDTQTTLGDIFETLAAKDGLFQKSFSFNDKVVALVDGKNIDLEYKNGFDLKGSDYEHYRTSFEKCIADCYSDVKCVSWTYIHGECWKKEGIPSPVEESKAKCGWFAHKFKCKHL